jgi:glutamate racemase
LIGVFDSGHGGLTVMRAFVSKLASERFVYLGDHANAPYGNLSASEIIDLTRENVERLFGLGCRLVVLGCNTASAIALRRLQEDWLPTAHPDRRVLGIVVPTVEVLTSVPWHVTEPPAHGEAERKTVVLFATRQTVASGAYPFEVARRAPHVEIVQQACPGLAGAIEADAPQAEIDEMVALAVSEALSQLDGRRPDAAVLGCTHFPLVAPSFTATLPEGVRVLRQPEVAAASLFQYLIRHPAFRNGGGDPVFLTTGDPTRVAALAARFYGAGVQFQPLREGLPAAG